jgi:hypothetical protein
MYILDGEKRVYIDSFNIPKKDENHGEAIFWGVLGLLGLASQTGSSWLVLLLIVIVIVCMGFKGKKGEKEISTPKMFAKINEI